MRALPIVLVTALLLPAASLAQSRVPPEADRSNSGSTNSGSSSSGGSSGGASQAVPRESPPPPPPPSAAPRPQAVPREQPVQRQAEPAPSAPRSSAAAAPADDQAQRRQRVPPEARRDNPSGGAPRVGTAVPRPPNQPPRVAGDRDRNRGGYAYPNTRVYNNYYYYPRRYYPYGYGAFGLGYFYYDPYSWGPTYYGGGYDYPVFRGYGYGYPTGELRLDVSPRDAEVYVDGYYAGRVDDFDGLFQSLELEEGTYRIEIVAPGFASLDFDVRIYPGRKITYRGDLLRSRR